MFSGGFGKPATPAFGASGGSLFGSSAGSTFGSTGATAFGSAPAATSAFGAPTPAPAFGATSTAAPAFGVPATPAPAFGAPSTTAPAFGAPTKPTPTFGAISTAAPAFGATTAAAPAFGAAATSAPLFGSSTTTAAPAFGAAATSAPLFGSSATTAAPAFGASTATAAPAFGASTAVSAPLFGASTAVSAPLFGAPSTAAASTFGATQPAAPLFGAPATAVAPAFGAPVVTAAPAVTSSITGKTKFVDLPEAVQKQLVEIERQKAVQIQIGSSIIADETEREVRAVGQSVQRLAQELAVVKMTMSGDREMVEDAKQQVGFAVKHAEKGASLVAHATDDGSWAQSGLTPLQVATRQKALLALQVSDGQAALLRGTERSADDKQLRDGLSVDPYEAVRRIQVASMHYDAASEYYWAWLTRVESSAQLLAERLDQLERHVSSAVARQQQQSDDARDQPAARPTPRAVSDVIQYQNDSFIAIAGRVAALDDDVRRLRRRLGLKDGAAVPAAVHLLS